MKCACMNIDALNACGVYAAGPLDNGVAVKLVKMVQDGTKTAQGFEFEVKPASASDLGVWVVNTPEAGGKNIEVQLFNDPRYFYNEAGAPMSIKKLVAGVDYLEMDKNCFTDGTIPDGTASKDFATIGAGGKWTTAAEAPVSGGYLEFVAKHTVAVGSEIVPTVIMRYAEKQA